MTEKPVPNWLKPLWSRLIFVLIPTIWSGVEIYHAQWMWAALFGAAAVWGVWTLIIKFDPDGTIR